MTVAVGIDPSLTCTGVAQLDLNNGHLFTYRVVTGNRGNSLRARRDRMREVIAGILESIPPRVAITLIEVPHSRGQFGAQNERVALYWWLVDQLLARGPVVEVAPARRAKLATGRGNAKKHDVVTAMRAAFPGAVIPDDNVADAVAMAAAAAHWAGRTQNFNTGQLAAYDALDWPTIRTTTTKEAS